MIRIGIDTALSLTARIASLGVMIGAVELLVHAPLCYSRGLLAGNRLYGQPVLMGVVVLRLLAAAGVFVFVGSAGPWMALAVVATSIFLHGRNQVSQTAAEQITLLTFVGLSVASIGNDPVLQKAGLWFIALQGSLSYLTAGWHKLVSPSWRDGSAVKCTFNTRTYGHPGVSALLHKHARLSFLVGWSVIVWECLFPIALLSPYLAVPICAMALAFHAGTTLVMKFNNFLWAFAACYPAVIYCSL